MQCTMDEAMENVTTELLKLEESKRDGMRKAVEQVSSSLQLLNLQWKELKEHSVSVEKWNEERFESARKTQEKQREELERTAERLRVLQEVEAKCRQLEETKSGVEEREKSVERREREVEWKGKRVEVKRKKVEERCKEVEFKEKEFESVRKTIDKCLDKLEEEEKRLCSRGKAIEERCEEVEGKEEELGLREKSIEERGQVVEVKERELELKQMLIEERGEEVERKEKELASMQKSIEERGEEVELKERELGSRQKSIEGRNEEVERKERELASMQKSIEERGEEVELKERELGSWQNSIEGRNEEVERKEKELASMQKSIEERGEEVELKERELGSRQNSIEGRNEEVERKERELASMQKTIEEHGEEVKLKERELGSRQNSIEGRNEEVERKERELDMRQKTIEERGKQVELKERELGSRQNSIEGRNEEVERKERELGSRRKSIEERNEEVERKERELDTRQKTIEERGKQVELKERELDSRQKSIEEHGEEVELKERELGSRQNSIEERNEEVERKEGELDMRQKTIEERLAEVILKERGVCSMQKLIDKQLKEGELWEERVDVGILHKSCSGELDLKEKKFDVVGETMGQCIRELEWKQKHHESCLQGPSGEAASKENQLSSIQYKKEAFLQEVELKGCGYYSNQEATEVWSDGCDLRFCIAMDGKKLQMFLNNRFTGRPSINDEVFIVLQMSSDPAKLVLDAMQGFYPPHFKEGNMEFEASVIRKSCILLLQQLRRVSPPIKVDVKEAALKLAGDWKAKMRPEAENSLEVLGFLLLVATYGLDPGFNFDDLVNHFQTVAQHKQAPELCQTLGFADADTMSENLHSQLKMSPIQDSQANYAINSSSASHLFFANIDRSLQLFPNEHWIADRLMLVNAALQMLSNPAKVVLDALRGELEKGNANLTESDIRDCILLLEQLKKNSPEINTQVKEEAMTLAIEWKAKLREEIGNSLEVLNLLLFVATYGLDSALNGDEVLIFFKAVAQHQEAPQLCRDLGFVDKISDYVQFLIEENDRLKAIRYIYVFELDDKFPILRILEDHLKYCVMVSRKICKKRNCTVVARVVAADKEIAALREVIKCIADYKLEFKFLSEDIGRRINRLEKQKVSRNFFAPSPAPKEQLQLNSVNKRPKIAASSEAAQITSTFYAPESQFEE